MQPNDHHHALPTAADVVLLEHADGGAFLIARDGVRIAEMTFVHAGPSRARFDHTHVAPELRGHGIAALLLQAAVEWARRTGIRMVPECSYVRDAFARDPSIGDVLA
jgi:predicted GNAT family acetyltransferase